MRKSTFLTLILLFLMGCGASKQATPGPGVSLLVIGDSLTAGYGLDTPKIHAWPAILEREWRRGGFLTSEQKVVNAGISGDTSQGGLNRIEGLLKEHQPGVVAIALGSNDVRKRTNGADIYRNLSEMVQIAQQAEAQVILIGVDLPSVLSLAASGEPNKTIDRVAREHGLDRVNIPLNVISRKNMMLDDQIHPNLEAQDMIAQSLKQSLERVMSE